MPLWPAIGLTAGCEALRGEGHDGLLARYRYVPERPSLAGPQAQLAHQVRDQGHAAAAAVLVAGGRDRRAGRAPRNSGRVGCRKTEGLQQPGPVVGQGLARPLARDQDPVPGIAQVLASVGLAPAVTGPHPGPGVARGDAVAQLVRAGGRAGFVTQGGQEPGSVVGLGRGRGLVAGADVLGQVADAPGDAAGSGQDAL